MLNTDNDRELYEARQERRARLELLDEDFGQPYGAILRSLRHPELRAEIARQLADRNKEVK